jgi:pimeloyl-ACP methyl ester carboxylesterase
MAKVTVNGCELWYEIKGSGKPVVQIGGAVSGHEGYVYVTPEMAKHFAVIDYDHRGYGMSDRPRQTYTMDTWADDLAGLLDALSIQKCHVHGGSMGGYIAIKFATKYPDRVDRLVINGAAARSDFTSRCQFEVWKAVAREYGMDSMELARELCTKAFSRAHLDGPKGGPQAVRWMQEATAPNASLHVFLDACDAMIETDVTPQLGRVSAPTLLMVGSEDVLTPIDQGPEGAGMRYMHEHIPGSELWIAQGSGHGLLAEMPEQTVAKVIDFLSVN